MSDRRVSWIDIAKGIGILLVVYGHAARGVFHAGIPMDRTAFETVDGVLYSFHMPLFFVLSGFLFLPSWRKRGGGELFWRKTATILYPFVLWTLIQGTLDFVFGRFTNRGEATLDLVAMLGAPETHLWFLQALFLLFALNLALLGLGEKRGLFVSSVLGIGLFPFADRLPGPAGMVAGYLLYFNLGLLLGPWLISHEARRPWRIASAACLIFLSLTLVARAATEPALQLLRLPAAVLAVSGSAAVLALAQACSGRVRSGLALLGRYSLEIYLMHVLAEAAVRIGLQKVLGVDSAGIHLVLGTAAGVMLPLIATAAIYRLHGRLLFAMPLSPSKRPQPVVAAT